MPLTPAQLYGGPPDEELDEQAAAEDVETARRIAAKQGHTLQLVPPDTYTMIGLAEWDESAHPRDEKGKFASGGGGTAVAEMVSPEVRSREQWMAAQLIAAAGGPGTIDRPTMVQGAPKLVSHDDLVDYVSSKGEENTPAPLPKGVARGPLGNCYENASNLIMEQRLGQLRGQPPLTYTEGFASPSGYSGLAFMHAWCTTPDGTVVDPTWDHPETSTYFGVQYPTTAYFRHVSQSGYYGVLGGEDRSAAKVVATGSLLS
jgi:hypothetical protein